MGILTHDQLVSAGLELAGNTSLTSHASVWLNTWLRDVYMKHPWPFLQKRYGPISMTVGASAYAIGNGSGGSVTDRIFRVKRVALADTVNTGFKGELNIGDEEDVEPWDDPAWIDTLSRGLGTEVFITSAGADPFLWTLSFNKPLDRAYRILVTAQYLPGAVTTSGVPIYQNDETMIHAIYVKALKHQDDPRSFGEGQALQAMVAADRVALGRRHGARVNLSRRSFRR